MGQTYDEITTKLGEWIERQRVFFVSTAPLAAEGLLNCSPKGMDSFRILGPKEVAYLDLTGSGVETIAHLRENGRIVLMFCAFEGPPKIVRLHGRGEAFAVDSPEFEQLSTRFPRYPATRSIVRVRLTRISDSCGYAVPRYEFEEERDTLAKWGESKSPEELARYWQQKNTRSIDGLPGMNRCE